MVFPRDKVSLLYWGIRSDSGHLGIEQEAVIWMFWSVLLGAVIFAVGILLGAALASNNKVEDGFTTLVKILEKLEKKSADSEEKYRGTCPICNVILHGEYDTVKEANDEFRHHMRTKHPGHPEVKVEEV